MFYHVFSVAGDTNTWIGTLGTFWGAILGGLISGVVTLKGVEMSIKASNDGMKETINEQSRIRNEDIFLQTQKERLIKLYQPITSLFTEAYYEQGEHTFYDLAVEQQNRYLKIINENDIYADFQLSTKFTELMLSFRENEEEIVNEKYIEIGVIMSEEQEKLRQQLRLPK
jgi:hypothetical protein